MSAPRPSSVTEDYLKVIWKSGEWSNEGISTNEIAQALGLSASSVSGNLGKLARDGYIHHEPYGRIALTAKGTAIAVQMVRRHRLIETYLVEHHGYGWDEVHDEAEILEHAVSDRLLRLIDEELGFPTQDPHGDPIPREDGSIVALEGRRLHEFAAGSDVVIVRVSDHDPALLRYLESLGFAVGTRLRVDAVHDFAGSLTVISDAGSRELATLAANAIWVAAA